MLRCRIARRVLVLGCSTMPLLVGGLDAPSFAARAASTSSRDAYINALIPVGDAVLEGSVRPSADDSSCLAEQYVDGFTLRRLRAVGSPATVLREMLKDTLDLNRFGVTEERYSRITTTAVWECLGIGRMLEWGLHRRGGQLSQSSVECLEAEFDSDPKAQSAYITATIRELNDKPRVVTPGLARSASILVACLTPEERAVLQG